MSIAKQFLRRSAEPFSVAAVTAFLLFARLMFPRPVGVADNYDGGRLLCHFNLASTETTDVSRKWVTFRYVFKNTFNCNQATYGPHGPDLPHPAYESSQLVLVQLGHWLTQLLGLNSSLDLRALGFVACAFIGGAIGLLFHVLDARRRYRYLLCGAIVVMTADAIFIDFAISPLSEIASVIGVLYLLPAAILLFRGGRSRWYGLALGLGAGMFLTASKAQMFILAVPVAILLGVFPLPVARVRGLRGRIGSRVIPAAAAAALLAGTMLYTPKQDPHFSLQTRADLVFTQLLRVSPDPAGDMRALGIPAEYIDQIGQTAWCNPHKISVKEQPNDAAGNPLPAVPVNSAVDPVLDKALSNTNIAKFLLTHPDRAIRVMDTTADAFFYARPTWSWYCPAGGYPDLTKPLGNYGTTSGAAAMSVDKRFTPVTSTLGLLRDTGLIPLLAVWLVPLLIAGRLLTRRTGRATGDRRALAWLTLLASSTAGIEFGVGAFGDGIDTSKHLNLSIYATVLAVVLAIAAARFRGASAETAAGTDADFLPSQSRTGDPIVDSTSTVHTDGLRTLVIIPTYNESENIERIVARVHTSAPHVHILVADDNSPDGTGEIADKLADKDERIHVMHRQGKEGLGKAYLAGFAWGLEAGYDVLVEMDADGSHRPEDFPRLYEALVETGADLVLGSRYVKGGSTVNWPKHREILSKGGNLWIRLVTGMPLRDATGGYRLFRRGTLEAINLDAVESAGYTFQVDLAWRTVRAGLKVVEVPITFVEREFGASKMNSAIVKEALWRTTVWGTKYRLGRLVGKK